MEAVSLCKFMPPLGQKGAHNQGSALGFTWVSKLQASLLSARWDIGSFFLSGLKNSNPRLTKALGTGGQGPFWSQNRGSSTQQFSSSFTAPGAGPSLSPQALTPNLLSKCLGRVQPGGQCTKGWGARRMGCACNTRHQVPREEKLSLPSGSRLRCKDKRSSD